MTITPLKTLAICLLLLSPKAHFGQIPSLGTAANFAFFTSVGAFSNAGATYITGNIGTNSGALTGFPPGTLVGQAHVANTTSAQAALDVDAAYTYLTGLTCGTTISVALGNQTLTPSVYCIEAASTLTGNLILDGQGNPNALFIFKIEGALTTAIASNILLTNAASQNNVFWQVNGAVVLGENSNFKGTIVGNAAISMLESATLSGRALSRQGAIDLHNNNALVVLPIDLVYFSAKNQEKGVLLNWATASERNNSRVELQKSFDARDFESLSTFSQTETTDKKSYTFLDVTPFEKRDNTTASTVYYRLKQTDASHAFDYSKIVAVTNETKSKMSLYPNPASNSITLKNAPDAQAFFITDVLGKVVSSGQYSTGNALNISQLPTGLYSIRIQFLTLRFLKN